MAAPDDAFLIVALTVGIAGAVGYGIFRFILPKGRAETPVQMGRKWFAWVALIMTVTLLPEFIRTFDVDPLALWLVGFLVWGGLAFMAGWLYGKLSGFKGSTPILVTTPAQPPMTPKATELPSISQGFSSSLAKRLEELNELHRKNLVTEAEYERQRARILNEL